MVNNQSEDYKAGYQAGAEWTRQQLQPEIDRLTESVSGLIEQGKLYRQLEKARERRIGDN